MGSIQSTGLYTKSNYTFRKLSVDIQKTDSKDDITNTITTTELPRSIGSGSIITDGGVCHYYENKVWGMFQEGRSSSDRVASKPGASRQLKVDKTGSGTLAVIPSALEQNTPQSGVVNTGNRVVINDSVTDIATRKSNS